MTQIFDEKGDVIPVTLIEAGPCYVLNDKESVQIGFGEISSKKEKNKLEKSWKKRPYKYVKEFKREKKYSIGDKIDVSIFKENEIIAVSGVSKGKGFQGIIKRHGAKSKPASHGTKHEERAMGSSGSSYPERVIKGRTMPGHMGFERATVKNLKIAKIDLENNLLAVKGAVPGRRGALLEIKSAE